MAALSLGSGSRMVIPCQLMEGGGGEIVAWDLQREW